MKKGFFISIEGVEGVGKSTAMHILKKKLELAGISYVMTREPGGTAIAEQIRGILLHKHEELMAADTELLLMFASRAQNIHQIILPALKRGQWVLSDRFTDASFAYQGGGREIELKRIEKLAQWVLGDLVPDLTFLLDAPVKVGLQRIHERGEKDRIENEEIAFFERVRNAYLQLAKTYPQRFRIIHSEKNPQDVEQQILTIINPIIENYS